ncbi:hypothetical protein NDU88_002022 [Pleurodeles waltl]|uniref:Uncharacterized protein n=1 Tax=Pleurodeles waltl TaxID=8319 RepID=A0AAV7UBZ3_PLEWA|nr:hypothetical protein NDU88_002022 [Pleurodeles waltl]
MKTRLGQRHYILQPGQAWNPKCRDDPRAAKPPTMEVTPLELICPRTNPPVNQPASCFSRRSLPTNVQDPIAEALDAHLGAQPDSMIERILQEIAVVGRRFKGMDTRISELNLEFWSLRTNIAGFQDRVTGLDQRLTLVDDKLNQPTATSQFLRDKLMDLEDRSCRDNVCFFGVPERAEGIDARAFLQDIIPTITGLSFSPLLEFQRAYRIGPLHKDARGKPRQMIAHGKPRQMIACFQRHEQAQQLLTAARTHGPYT